MYEIYINETPLILCATEDLPEDLISSETILVNTYPGRPHYLLNYIDMLEKSNRFEKVYIHFKDYKKLKKDFTSIAKIIKAAGGLVLNENGEILFIHRRNNWDLPKGKMEKGESKKDTAVREVKEETGINEVTITKSLITTNHLYRDRSGKRKVKRSYWYLMQAPKQKLVPQTDEDIVEARWMTIQDWEKQPEKTYENIKIVLKAAKSELK